MTAATTRDTRSDGLPDDVRALLDPLDAAKQAGSGILIAAMRDATGMPPTLWSGAIVGFASYRYRYASGREGESCALGFSPRAREFSLYLHIGALDDRERASLLQPLGKVREGKGCLYLKDPCAVDPEALATLLRASLHALAASPSTTSITLGPGVQEAATLKA